MFINRPLINGRSQHKDKALKHSSSFIQPKNHIRIKTLPNSVHTVGNRHSEVNDLAMNGANLIGIKDIRELMDGDMEKISRRLKRLEEDTQEDEKILRKGMGKTISRKSTINRSEKEQLKAHNQPTLQEQEQRAYLECLQLLNHQQKHQQKVHQKFSQQLSRKFYQLQETRIELEELRKEAMNELSIAKGEVTRVQQDNKLVMKRLDNRQRLADEINFQKGKIAQMHEKLFASKQESIRQKNMFVEIQAEEIRLVKEIEAQQELQVQQNEEWEQFEYMKKMEKLKQKLIRQKAKSSNQIDDFFKEKIASIAKVRVTCDELQQKAIQLCSDVEEQEAVIEMLSKKSHEQEEVKGDTAELKYISNYQKIFNSAGSPKPAENEAGSESENEFREIDHWQNYKFYLRKILNNEKRLQELEGMPDEEDEEEDGSQQLSSRRDNLMSSERNSTQLIKSSHLERSQLSRPEFNPINNKKKGSLPSAINSQFTPNRNQSKISQPPNTNQSHNKPLDNPSHSRNPNDLFRNPNYHSQNPPIHIEKSRTPLPKLVKMQGNLSDKDKIKKELTKFTNHQLDESVELETVRTSQCDGEDVIEVEFKGVKPKLKELPMVKKEQSSLINSKHKALSKKTPNNM